MSLDAIHARAGKFQSKIFWRNMREYAACGIGAVIFTGFAMQSDSLIVQAGSMLIVLGLLFMCLFLHFNGRADREGAQAFDDCLDFHRKSLIRQRNLLRGVWLWYLMPMVPGLALFVWGVNQESGAGSLRLWLSTGFLAAVFIGVFWLNAWGARCLQKELDRLAD